MTENMTAGASMEVGEDKSLVWIQEPKRIE